MDIKFIGQFYLFLPLDRTTKISDGIKLHETGASSRIIHLKKIITILRSFSI